MTQGEIDDQTDSRALFRALDLDSWFDYFVNDRSTYPWTFGLDPMGGRKPIRDVLGLARLWSTARDALNFANNVYIVGFSLSPFDRMARLLFADAARPRMDGRAPNYHLLDPKALTLAPSFHGITRAEVFACPCYAHEIQWDDLSGWIGTKTQ